MKKFLRIAASYLIVIFDLVAAAVAFCSMFYQGSTLPLIGGLILLSRAVVLTYLDERWQ